MFAGTASPVVGAAAPFREYVRLLKPRVMSLAVFTALVGMASAPVDLHPVLGLAAILCIAGGAGAAGALNMWWDADIDRRMPRTRNRPVASGRLPPETARDLGLGLGALSAVLLALFANLLAGALLALTVAYYAVVYTIWLKRTSVHAVVVGGVAGALPPLVGWVAATGSLAWEPLLMALVILLWTPPHSWALALLRRSEYSDVSVPTLPKMRGVAATQRQILIYTMAMAAAGVLLACSSVGGWSSLGVSVLLGGVMLWRSLALFREGSGRREEGRLFGASIAYLFLLFAALLVDRSLDAGGFFAAGGIG